MDARNELEEMRIIKRDGRRTDETGDTFDSSSSRQSSDSGFSDTLDVISKLLMISYQIM